MVDAVLVVAVFGWLVLLWWLLLGSTGFLLYVVGARLACGLWAVVDVFDGGVIGDAALGFFLVVLSFGWLIARVSCLGCGLVVGLSGLFPVFPVGWLVCVSGWLVAVCCGWCICCGFWLCVGLV